MVRRADTITAEAVLDSILDDFQQFESAGWLIDLKEFLTLDNERQSHIRMAAEKLHGKIERFTSWIEATKLLSEYPLVNLPLEKFEYFKAHIRPRAGKVGRLAFENPGLLLELDELLNDIQGPAAEPNAVNPHDWLKATALRMLNYLDVGGVDCEEQYLQVEIDVNDIDPEALRRLRTCLRSRYFQPEGWLQRASNVEAVNSQRSADQFPLRIRGRLKEAFDAYIVGLYFASIASCRSLLEFILLDRAKPRLGFDPYVTHDGKVEAMELWQLIEQAGKTAPELKKDLDFVRAIGNDLLHPPRGREIDQFPPQERTARKALSIVCSLISRVYT